MSFKDLEKRLADIIRITPLVRTSGPTQIAASVTNKFREIFLEAMPETLAELGENESDYRRLTRAIHRLKGATGFVGATRLCSLASDFEKIAEQLKPEQLQYFVIVLKRVLSETEGELRRLLVSEAR